MGVGASVFVKEAFDKATDDDVKAVLASLPEDARAKLSDALKGAPAAAPAAAAPAKEKPFATLVFSRHGESEWNVANKFTGWVDVDLSEKGVGEAKGAGKLIKEEGLEIDQCFTSVLKRAIKTCDLVLESSDQLFVPVTKTWRLNERMYGGLQGLDKKETVAKHGADQVQIWRRSFDLPPPEIEKDNACYTGGEDKYKDLKPEEIPTTESLKDVIARVMPYWSENITPVLKEGKTVFVAAHGNSIRAIVKDMEAIPDDVIPGLEIPTATPLVYELDKDLKPIPSDLAVPPLKFGRYLGDAEAIKAAAEAVKNQTKVG
jgi:2,3-bisphosphoglycerate-dependent phosphoglycerate mutase